MKFVVNFANILTFDLELYFIFLNPERNELIINFFDIRINIKKSWID